MVSIRRRIEWSEPASRVQSSNVSLHQRLHQGDEMFCLEAFEETLIDMIGFHREEVVKNCHKRHVLGLYIQRERRGQGDRA